jgi:hypothetical protein
VPRESAIERVLKEVLEADAGIGELATAAEAAALLLFVSATRAATAPTRSAIIKNETALPSILSLPMRNRRASQARLNGSLRGVFLTSFKMSAQLNGSLQID